MTIHITQPEIEAIIQKRLQSGAFRDAEEVILDALKSSGRDDNDHRPTDSDKNQPRKSLVELSKPVRGLLTDEEVDRLFIRNPSTGRPVDLS